MMEYETNKINVSFPSFVCELYGKLLGVYIEVSVSVYEHFKYIPGQKRNAG